MSREIGTGRMTLWKFYFFFFFLLKLENVKRCSQTCRDFNSIREEKFHGLEMV